MVQRPKQREYSYLSRFPRSWLFWTCRIRSCSSFILRASFARDSRAARRSATVRVFVIPLPGGRPLLPVFAPPTLRLDCSCLLLSSGALTSLRAEGVEALGKPTTCDWPSSRLPLNLTLFCSSTNGSVLLSVSIVLYCDVLCSLIFACHRREEMTRWTPEVF